MSLDDVLSARSRTKGRAATTGVIPGRYALSVGMPELPTPTGWKWTPLSSVARLESGHTPSRRHPEYWGGDVPWIGIRDAVANHGRVIYDTNEHISDLGLQNSSARLLPANTVCLSRTASVGYVTVMGRPMATSQDFVNWVCDSELQPQFLKFVLLAERDSLWRFASGTTHQTIYYPEVKAFHICLPPIEEQRAIVHILGTLDDKIELNRRMNATLEEMARALFKSWFVDFDPVRAKAAGRQPFGMDAETAALFPDSFEQSELGEIPRGWRVGSIGDLVTIVRRGINPSSYPDEEFDHFSIPAFDEGRIPKRELGCTIKSNKYLVSPTAVLLSKLNPRFPRVWLPNILTTRRSICSTEFLVAEPEKSVSREYVYSLFQSEPFLDRFASLITGTSSSHQRVKPHDLVNMRVIRPDGDALRAFTSIVENLYLRAMGSVVESTQLMAARDALLPRLLAGRL